KDCVPHAKKIAPPTCNPRCSKRSWRHSSWVEAKTFPHSPQEGTMVATTMANVSLRNGSWLPMGAVLSPLFSLPWVRSCFRRLDDTTKALPQRLHLNGRSPESKLLPHSSHWWRLRSHEATKLLSHCKHLWGLSPVWMRWCMARSAGWRKAFPHLSQAYGLRPWWVLRCLRKLEGSLNMRPHCGQRKGFSPEWVRWWLWKEDSWVKPFPQRLQR
uniref:Uncharacterized protein n=1 Tax=Naja naja TaxID=35670 RepID=A0A8C7E0Y9_NAJNA